MENAPTYCHSEYRHITIDASLSAGAASLYRFANGLDPRPSRIETNEANIARPATPNPHVHGNHIVFYSAVLNRLSMANPESSQESVVQPTTQRRPMTGVKVLDLSRVVSGPVVGRIFADMGADVVKVESPDGDVTRLWGSIQAGVPGFFLQQNAGKRGVCVDMRADGAAELIVRLASVADVVIENFRGGVMERMGIGWSTLCEHNARLVMLSITGFGQTGPEAHRPAYASVIQAESGIVGRQLEIDGGTPKDLIASVADYNAGLHGCIATMAALMQARATGVGDHIDLAMIDSMVATDDYMHFALDGGDVPKLGGEYYATADGAWTLISGPVNHVFRTIAPVAGIADPTSKTDSASAKLTARRDALRAWAATLPNRLAFTTAIDSVGLPWGALNTPSTSILSPTLAFRNSIGSVELDDGTNRRVVQMPYRFQGSNAEVRSRSPHLGEHNAAVLQDWLGDSDKQVSHLVSAGVLLSS
jgi:CoA:oxalate CoA-transferase